MRLETTAELVVEARATASALHSFQTRWTGDSARATTSGTLVETARRRRASGLPEGRRLTLTFDRLLATLPARESEALRLRFKEGLVQREIGPRLGISQMQVSRPIRQAIERLQQTSGSDADTLDTLARPSLSSTRARPPALQLGLVHRRAAVDAELARLFIQLVARASLRPVGPGAAAAAA